MPSAHFDAYVCRSVRHSRLGHLHCNELSAVPGAHRSMTAGAYIKTLAILAQPAVNHVGIQPVAQRYRGNGCVGMAAAFGDWLTASVGRLMEFMRQYPAEGVVAHA